MSDHGLLNPKSWCARCGKDICAHFRAQRIDDETQAVDIAARYAMAERFADRDEFMDQELESATLAIYRMSESEWRRYKQRNRK